MHVISEFNWSECIKPAEEASSLPPICYTSSEIVNQEIQTIFRGSWIGVGRSDIVKEPGNYICLDFAEQSVILLRDKNGKLRSFANTCRHRGARLLDGEGSCKGIRCPFHSWFYGLDGKLITSPHMNKAQNFDKNEYGLIEYLAEEYLGFAFICLNKNGEGINSFLSDFKDIHSPWPIEPLVSVRRRELTVNCNWKMFLEVFNEYYHLPFVHPNSVDSIYLSPSAAEKVKGSFATQFGETDGTGGLLEDTQENALPDMPDLKGLAKQGARYTWIFPNMTFAANRDALWCYEAYPLGHDKCKVLQTACFHPKTISLSGFSTKVKAYLYRLDAALEEDIPALMNQQVGLTNPDSMPGRFQPNLEPNVASFANWYAKRW